MSAGSLLEPVNGLYLFAAIVTLGVTSAVWVYRDARAREFSDPIKWSLAVGFLFVFYVIGGIVALLIYVLLSREAEQTVRPGDGETASADPPQNGRTDGQRS